MSEAELLEAFKRAQKDPHGGAELRRCVEALLDLHYQWLERMCFYELRSQSNATDCLQEVLVEIASSLAKFDGRSELKTWVYVIAQRVIWKFRKRDTIERGRFSEFDEAALGEQEVDLRTASGSRAADDLVVISEQSKLLLRLIDGLALQQRQAVMLYYFEGLSVEEVATRIGCSDGAVKSHLSRARKNLEQGLKKLGIDRQGLFFKLIL